MSSDVREYSREPCPICGHVGWCGRRDDGLVLCKRPPMPREVPGFVFRGMGGDNATGMYVESGRERNNGQDNRTATRVKPAQSSDTRETKVTPEWLTENHPRLVANLDDERRDALAAQLRLPPSSLDTMPIGWWPNRRWWNPDTQQHEGDPGCWTFPEYDAQCRTIGLGLRWPTGQKGQLAGGRRGLIIPVGWREAPDPVLIVEGPSDVLAGRWVGLNCIGRPNNSGGVDLLVHVCRNRQVIVLGENDRKSDGRWPGKEGAEAVARRLETAWNRPVPVAYPPANIKDLRAWVVDLIDGSANPDTGTIPTTIQSALQPPALVWLVGPRDKRGRVLVKVFRWADGPEAAPIYSDRLNLDQEAARKRFAKSLAKVEPQVNVDDMARRLIAVGIPPDDNANSPRERSTAGRGDVAAATSHQRDLPTVLLPGGPVPIQECAEKLGRLLASGERHFVRGGAIVTVSRDEAGQQILDTVKPAALASVFETVARLMILAKSEGELVQQPAVCSEQQAKLIQHCEAFQDALPPLRLLSACPVLIERDGALVQICGYDRGSGILAIATPADDVPLDEAVELLSKLLSEFRFATAADKARAFAAIITPALVMGGLLGGRAPVDLGEADASQSGKGFRNKLTAAIYGQTVRTVTQKKGGVGSLEETFSTALIRGANFISLDNVRGQIDSPAIESFVTEDSYLARVPHQAAIEVNPARVTVQLTSNRAEITPDLANRSSCVRILKQPDGYRFREYPEGDILDHVRAQQPRYLGAVFAVVRAWHEAGKPRTNETRHDFRPWARTLDWIVQNIFHAGPLLDGHRETQVRMATPALNWLRDVALAVRDAGQLDVWLRAAQLVEVLVASAVDLPGLAEGGDMEDEEVRKKVLQAVGRRLAQCFRREHTVVIDGIEVERREQADPDHRRINREYRFRMPNPLPDECAYAPEPDWGRIGANPTSDGSEGDLEAPEDAEFGLDAPVCAYGAPIAAPMRAPIISAVAPIAPMGHVIPMRENSVSEGVCIYADKYRKVMEPIGALGANSPESEGFASVDPRPPPSVLTAHWVSEACDHLPPPVVQLAVEREGWTPEHWRDRLLYLAELCAEDHPGRAAELRQAAELMTGTADAANEA